MSPQEVMKRLLHARSMEQRAARRLKLAVTTWEKWSRKVGYYSKRLASVGTKKGEPNR